MAVAAGQVFAQRDVDAPAPPGGDIGRERCDVALPGAAVHTVVAIVAVDKVEIARAAVEGVDAEAAGDLVVVAGPAEEGVVAEVPDHPVVTAGAAVGEVVAAAAVDQVGTRAAAEQVVAEAAEDHIVTIAAPDHVPAGGAGQLVGTVGADDSGLAPVAARNLFFVRCRRPGEQHHDKDRQRREGASPHPPTHRRSVSLVAGRSPVLSHMRCKNAPGTDKARFPRPIRRCESASC